MGPIVDDGGENGGGCINPHGMVMAWCGLPRVITGC